MSYGPEEDGRLACGRPGVSLCGFQRPGAVGIGPSVVNNMLTVPGNGREAEW